MGRRHLRCVALLLLLAMLPAFTGCGGGIVELALTAKRVYGLWRLWKLFDDGSPSWIQVASALLQLHNNRTYELFYVDSLDQPVQTETGTWSVEPDTLILNVDQSQIDPAAAGQTLRLPAKLLGEGGDRLSITRRIQTGQVVVSQEQVYRREAVPAS